LQELAKEASVTTMASGERAWLNCWLGRVREPDDTLFAQGAPARWVRIFTNSSGDLPGPTHELEEIADPLAWATGQASDLFERVASAKAVEGGLGGPLSNYRLEPPMCPQKVIGIGRNYRAHAEELGNEVPKTPLSFLKAPSCLLASGEAIALPVGYERIDMESELVVVIGRRASGVAATEAWQHVGGYCLGNDVSNRDLQKADKQWTRAKGSDGFGPLGPFIRLTEAGLVPPISKMKIRGYLNDMLVQEGSCDHMIFDIPTLIEHLSASLTLEVGDLIYTGTPAGVSALGPGDRVRVELEGFALAPLSNPVVRA
jgi:2-keto-4-pentenoate hydratase/2-oxohepta-3-ene-1,7-dioic acid hydratase in catechol pathway